MLQRKLQHVGPSRSYVGHIQIILWVSGSSGSTGVTHFQPCGEQLMKVRGCPICSYLVVLLFVVVMVVEERSPYRFRIKNDRNCNPKGRYVSMNAYCFHFILNKCLSAGYTRIRQKALLMSILVISVPGPNLYCIINSDVLN